MNSDQRKTLILEKMNAKNIIVGSGVPNRSYSKESEEVNELIRITNCFPELRIKNKKWNLLNLQILIKLINYQKIYIDKQESI